MMMKMVLLVAVLCSVLFAPTTSESEYHNMEVGTKIKKLLKTATPKLNESMYTTTTQEISDALSQIPDVSDKFRMCRIHMEYLRIDIIPRMATDCQERVRHPDIYKYNVNDLLQYRTIPEEKLKEIDDRIAKTLMETSLAMHCMPRKGKKWLDYYAMYRKCRKWLNGFG